MVIRSAHVPEAVGTDRYIRFAPEKWRETHEPEQCCDYRTP